MLSPYTVASDFLKSNTCSSEFLNDPSHNASDLDGLRVRPEHSVWRKVVKDP